MTFDSILEDGRLWAVHYDGEEDNALYSHEVYCGKIEGTQFTHSIKMERKSWIQKGEQVMVALFSTCGNDDVGQDVGVEEVPVLHDGANMLS